MAPIINNFDEPGPGISPQRKNKIVESLRLVKTSRIIKSNFQQKKDIAVSRMFKKYLGTMDF